MEAWTSARLAARDRSAVPGAGGRLAIIRSIGTCTIRECMSDWDKRYQQGEHINDAPHSVITSFAAKLPTGDALDVASGPGRHALWLAERGWHVTAVESSSTAARILAERARAKALPVRASIADLESGDFVIQPCSYDLIVVCNYLQRSIFPSLKEGTRPGGTLIAVINMVDDDPAIRPMNPEYLLNPGELRRLFAGWQLLHSFEGKPTGSARRAAAEIVARRVR